MDIQRYIGAYWRKLTTTAISVDRADNDGDIVQVRVRIWVYK